MHFLTFMEDYNRLCYSEEPNGMWLTKDIRFLILYKYNCGHPYFRLISEYHSYRRPGYTDLGVQIE
jgi:hypothetical protein